MTMSPEAELRMNVYQEGQRALSSGANCPYTDWRKKTWVKGLDAAREHRDRMIREASRTTERRSGEDRRVSGERRS